MNPFHRLPVRPQHGVLPKFWRLKVEPSRQLTCKVIHWDLITSIANGTATVAVLWDWIETGLTYSQMMILLIRDGVDFPDADQLAMNAQTEMYDAVIARYSQTRRVGFSGPELTIARLAACVMDDVITQDRHGIADQAARWSLEQMRSLRTTGKSARISF